MNQRCLLLAWCVCWFVSQFQLVAAAETGSSPQELLPGVETLLYQKLAIPGAFLVERKNHTFGGDIRIGDLNGDGRCDFLVYRCEHGAPRGAHMGGMKPCFLGAFEQDGSILWSVGKGGNQPSRPMSVAIHDMTGDGAADVICFWHRPRPDVKADWQSLADVVVQIRDGRTGKLVRESAPVEITSRRRQDPVGANWVHQRLLIANFRGTPTPRDIVVKLGDTYVALDEQLQVLWTYQTKWVKYSHCPAYIPAVGDIDGDGRDELNGGYFVIDNDGQPLWEQKLGRNMDSVVITAWDAGQQRAVCSGFGHVMGAEGEAVLSLGEGEVPHGQEVRIANLRDDLPGPEMVLRYNGHTPEALLVSSQNNQIVSRFKLNDSPTNVGMEPVYWRGPDQAALLFNGGWLWDLKTLKGAPLPGLPPPGGGKVHRMGFYHAIPANLCGDEAEELVLWDPTSTAIYIYTSRPWEAAEYTGYRAGPRQYNPRLMD
ncbi:FG-GAP repeat protein [Gimesia panareensis]|uniref:FG-GAP repeat protein n=1 Tax=Gimesia panareensis TaxID=2527978 RepID=A0A518FNB2_9PLAN|nr:hypothetical protein [Gimesia panareensis]QDV17843.1 FG-GAP repeat protein [Gimesia panareensis]